MPSEDEPSSPELPLCPAPPPCPPPSHRYHHDVDEPELEDTCDDGEDEGDLENEELEDQDTFDAEKFAEDVLRDDEDAEEGDPTASGSRGPAPADEEPAAPRPRPHWHGPQLGDADWDSTWKGQRWRAKAQRFGNAGGANREWHKGYRNALKAGTLSRYLAEHPHPGPGPNSAKWKSQ